MWRSRLFRQLFGIYTVLVVTAVGVLGWIVVGRVERYELQQIEQALESKAVLIDGIIRDAPPDWTASLMAHVRAWRERMDTRVTLIAADGRVLADSDENPRRMENHAKRPEISEARQKGRGTATRHSITVGHSLMYVALRTDGTTSVAYVRVGRPLEGIELELSRLRGIVWSFVAAAAASVLALAFWIARRMTRPLQELTAGAERIAAGDYGYKVFALGTDEIGALARSFNQMSDRLAEQFHQVQADREQLRAVLSGMVEGVLAIDSEQRLLFANERAAQLLGFPLEGAIGRKLWEVVRHHAIQAVVLRAQRSAEPYRDELEWNGPLVKNLAVYVARLPGPAPGAVLVLQDTSELRRLERVRQEFVANVSHELKTPLSVIKAGVETLLDGAIDDADHRGTFLQQIEEQANRLHALILDLISLGRIESGIEAFECKAVPLAPVVRECLERHRARAEAKKQTLEIVPPFAPGCCILPGTESAAAGEPAPADHADIAAWADEEAVGQILDNLVDNAVKYTPDGGRISIRWCADDRQVCLEVEDNGMGISDRDLPRIFERFYRVDKARSRELGGTGLGLSIVKHLVQAMEGQVSATSQVNQGTTFHVRLPRAVTASLLAK
jgi:two-component system phosphate regulon sensor histidine kinase PhoR